MKPRPVRVPKAAKIIIAAAIPLWLILVYVLYRLDLRPVASQGAAREFKVSPGQNAQTVAKHLFEAGLIRDRNAFVTYVNVHGLRPRLKSGIYNIAPTQSGQEIAELIAGGKTVSKRLVVPEGYTIKQITAAAANLGIDKAAFSAALAEAHNQPFLSAKPADVDLEGYLFPDSYEISASTNAQSLVNAMLNNFGHRVGDDYIRAFAAQGLTLHQGLTLSSIVEREVNIPADRPIVAQIFLKRLKTNMPLGSDVTTHYAADLLGVPFDININSPYNTRRYNGMPPGPICSPGTGALDAVAHPATTDYLYFLSGKDGKTYFAKTYAEHQRNIDKYLK